MRMSRSCKRCCEAASNRYVSCCGRYREGGLKRALYERPRQGAKRILNSTERQRIIAMVGADPPAGQARWTVRLIAEQAIKRKLVPQVGRETIRILLESHDLKPWREKNVVHH